MNIELLREDEICHDWSERGLMNHAHLLEQRLIEEREKNHDLTKLVIVVEAELAEARKAIWELYGYATGDNLQLDLKPLRAAIDAAMKGEK